MSTCRHRSRPIRTLQAIVSAQGTGRCRALTHKTLWCMHCKHTATLRAGLLSPSVPLNQGASWTSAQTIFTSCLNASACPTDVSEPLQRWHPVGHTARLLSQLILTSAGVWSPLSRSPSYMKTTDSGWNDCRSQYAFISFRNCVPRLALKCTTLPSCRGNSPVQDTMSGTAQ